MYRYWLFDHNNVNPIVTSILLHWYAPYIVIIAFLKHSPHYFIQLVPIGVCCCGFLVLFILSTSLPFPHPGLPQNREAGHGGAIPNREREQEVSHSGKWVGNRTRRRRIRGKREGHVLFCRNFEMLHSNEPINENKSNKKRFLKHYCQQRQLRHTVQQIKNGDHEDEEDSTGNTAAINKRQTEQEHDPRRNCSLLLVDFLSSRPVARDRIAARTR